MEGSEISFSIKMTSQFMEALSDRVAEKINVQMEAPAEGLTTTLYTVGEVAEMTKQDPRTVYNHITDGLLKAAKLGKNYRITNQNLQNYINNGK